MFYEIGEQGKDYLSTIRNDKLKLKEKGLYAFIYKFGGVVSFDDIFAVSKESYTSVMSGIDGLLKKEIARKVKVGKNEGVVYVIGDTYGNYKVGYAKSFYMRMEDFMTMFPYGPEVIKIIKTKEMRMLERELHDKFRHKNIRGEWFKLSDQDLKWIDETY
ncbi:MAG: GIY-YIG nuclease family protein [Thermacetogeniaceae bacterium]|jgi:hypothetical protein